jgi:hypothetical protein
VEGVGVGVVLLVESDRAWVERVKMVKRRSFGGSVTSQIGWIGEECVGEIGVDW